MKNTESILLFVESAKAKKNISFLCREENSLEKLITLALNLIRLGSPAINFTFEMKAADEECVESLVKGQIEDYSFTPEEKFNFSVKESNQLGCVFIISISLN